MSAQGAFGPGKGPIGAERAGQLWQTDPASPIGLGAPLVLLSSTYFQSKYGELYEIEGSGGGGTGSPGTPPACCVPGSNGASGGSGAAFILYWVGDGTLIPCTIGGVSGTTSFGSLATATGGSPGSGGTGGAAGTASGKAQVLLDGSNGQSQGGDNVGMLIGGFGLGGRAGLSGAGNAAGRQGYIRIKKLHPMNSEGMEGCAWTPGGATL